MVEEGARTNSGASVVQQLGGSAPQDDHLRTHAAPDALHPPRDASRVTAGPRVAPRRPSSRKTRSGEPEFPKWLTALGGVVAPPTLVTALAFYFGWARLNAEGAYFGLDPSVLGLGTQDYLLRSADVIFVPLGVLLAIGLLALATHSVVRRRLDGHPSTLQRLGALLAVSGTGLFVLGMVAIWRGLPFATPFLFPQLSPGLGVATLAYGLLFRSEARRDDRRAARPGLSSAVMSSIIFMLIALSLFLATAEYAGALGRGRAHWLAAHLLGQPGVIVYSHDRLEVHQPGVLETRIGDADTAYRYRYAGFRLLLRSGGSYYLVPALWSPENGTVVALQEKDSTRLEFTRGITP